MTWELSIYSSYSCLLENGKLSPQHIWQTHESFQVDSLVLSSLAATRVRKKSVCFKGWHSHMRSQQNYGYLLYIGWNITHLHGYYFIHRPWIKDPVTNQSVFHGSWHAKVLFTLLTYLMQELVVNLFLVHGGPSLCFWICSRAFVNIDFWLTGLSWFLVALNLTCNMSDGKLPTCWTRLNCNMSLWSLNPT